MQWDMGLIPGEGEDTPGEEQGNPLQYYSRGAYGQRSLLGHDPWGRQSQTWLSTEHEAPQRQHKSPKTEFLPYWFHKVKFWLRFHFLSSSALKVWKHESFLSLISWGSYLGPNVNVFFVSFPRRHLFSLLYNHRGRKLKVRGLYLLTFMKHLDISVIYLVSLGWPSKVIVITAKWMWEKPNCFS